MSAAEQTGIPAAASDPDRRPSPRRKTWVWTIVCAAVLMGGGLAIHHHRAAAAVAATSRNGTPPVPVVTGRVMEKDVPIYLSGLGTVQAFNTVTVHTRVDGELMRVAFTEGQDVKAGDLLAQIDPAPYQAALNQVAAKKAQDEVQLANARVDLKRYADLLATESTTRQIFDTQQALVDQLEASLKADQAAIDSARVNLDYTTVRSPIDGRTGIRLVDQGNIVHAGDAGGLVVLTQLKPISIVFTLPETQLPKLQDNRSQTDFSVLALARDNTNVLATGRLAVIDNQIDATTGMIRLKANFANADLRLWPGQFVNVRLLLATRARSTVVPASVVQRGPEGAFAFVVQDDLTAKVRPLKVAQIDGGEALITEGLQPGERVVVDGQYKLQDGARVNPVGPDGAAAPAPPNRDRPHKKQ